MTRLALAFSESGAGSLKAARVADRIVLASHTLVSGPVPRCAKPATFFRERAALYAADPSLKAELEDLGTRWHWRYRAGPAWRRLPATCKPFDHIDIWADAPPNSQFLLAQTLDWLRTDADVAERLAIVHVNEPLGGLAPDHPKVLGPAFVRVDGGALELASRVWHAFTQPTPLACAALLALDLDPLPQFRPALLDWLAELPAPVTALGATETWMLRRIAVGGTSPFDVIRSLAGERPAGAPRVLGYWEAGSALVGLAHAANPAIVGLPAGPFSLAMHDREERFERWKTSTLSLTDLGRALVRGDADWSNHNPIRRWWGGTHLTDGSVWRWDPAARNVVAPTK